MLSSITRGLAKAVVLSVLAIATLNSPRAQAVGGDFGAGNGGDAFAVDFQLKAKEVLDDLKAFPQTNVAGIDLAALQAKVESKDVKIITTEALISLRGERKDAINSNVSGDVIILSLTYWGRFNDTVKRTLALHEYLGLIGFEIGHYQDSIRTIRAIEVARNRSVGASTSAQDKDLDQRFTQLREAMRSPDEVQKGGDALDEMLNYINNAIAARELAKKEEQKNAKKAAADEKDRETYSVKIIKCARKIVRSKRGGEYGVEVAAQYLNLLTQKITDVEALEDLADSCKKNMAKLTESETTRDAQIERLKQIAPNYPAKVIQMVHDFARPLVACKRGGLQVGGGAIFGISLGLQAGYCHSSDGRRWVDLTPEVGAGGAVGAHVLVIWDKSEKEEDYSTTPMTLEGSTAIGLNPGNLFFLKGETSREHADAMNDGFAEFGSDSINLRDYHDTGFGLGIGNFQGREEALHLKLIPWFSNWHYLYTRIAK